MKLVGNKIVCNKTLQLLKKTLKAGYIDPETLKTAIPDMGTPQGSVLSPLLANIVLHEMDLFMDKTRNQFHSGTKRKRNKEYHSIQSKIQRLTKSQPGSPLIKELVLRRRQTPSAMPLYPKFKRLKYLRYADDFVVLITGSKDEAQLIKGRIKSILKKNCGLELNEDKTIITNTRDGFIFLGAYCTKPSAIKTGFMTKNVFGNPGRYRMRMRVLAPIRELLEKLAIYKFAVKTKLGITVPTARKDLVNLSHYEIITFYNNRIRGVLNFFSFAGNYSSLRKVIYILKFSCGLTLALKHKLRTLRRSFKMFGPLLTDPETGISIIVPKTMAVKHDYQKNKMVDTELLDKTLAAS